MRYFIYIAFNGTAYSGWQIQPDAPSVQQTLQEALFTFLRVQTDVVGAGRTDAGVHAAEMVAHFDLAEPKDCGWMMNKLNGILPTDIAVKKIVPVIDSSHARFDAKSRTYRYYVNLNKSPFDRDFSLRLIGPIDFDLMNETAKQLLTTIDFTSFSKLHTDTKTNNCKVTYAKWTQLSEEKWVFTITADRFLRNMVRAIVGTLLAVGRHQLTPQQFAEIIASKDRCKAGDSAPARGLFLEQVEYPDELFKISL